MQISMVCNKVNLEKSGNIWTKKAVSDFGTLL